MERSGRSPLSALSPNRSRKTSNGKKSGSFDEEKTADLATFEALLNGDITPSGATPAETNEGNDRRTMSPSEIANIFGLDSVSSPPPQQAASPSSPAHTPRNPAHRSRTPSKSCMSAKKQSEKKSRVDFSSPKAAEFRKESPVTSMTPIPSKVAREYFPLDNDSPAEESDEDMGDAVTTRNSSILSEWEEEEGEEEETQTSSSNKKQTPPSRSPRRSTLTPHEGASIRAQLQRYASTDGAGEEDDTADTAVFEALENEFQKAAAPSKRSLPEQEEEGTQSRQRTKVSVEEDELVRSARKAAKSTMEEIAPLPSPAVPKRKRRSASGKRSTRTTGRPPRSPTSTVGSPSSIVSLESSDRTANTDDFQALLKHAGLTDEPMPVIASFVQGNTNDDSFTEGDKTADASYMAELFAAASQGQAPNRGSTSTVTRVLREDTPNTPTMAREAFEDALRQLEQGESAGSAPAAKDTVMDARDGGNEDEDRTEELGTLAGLLHSANGQNAGPDSDSEEGDADEDDTADYALGTTKEALSQLAYPSSQPDQGSEKSTNQSSQIAKMKAADEEDRTVEAPQSLEDLLMEDEDAANKVKEAEEEDDHTQELGTLEDLLKADGAPAGQAKSGTSKDQEEDFDEAMEGQEEDADAAEDEESDTTETLLELEAKLLSEAGVSASKEKTLSKQATGENKKTKEKSLEAPGINTSRISEVDEEEEEEEGTEDSVSQAGASETPDKVEPHQQPRPSFAWSPPISPLRPGPVSSAAVAVSAKKMSAMSRRMPSSASKRYSDVDFEDSFRYNRSDFASSVGKPLVGRGSFLGEGQGDEERSHDPAPMILTDGEGSDVEAESEFEDMRSQGNRSFTQSQLPRESVDDDMEAAETKGEADGPSDSLASPAQDTQPTQPAEDSDSADAAPRVRRSLPFDDADEEEAKVSAHQHQQKRARTSLAPAEEEAAVIPVALPGPSNPVESSRAWRRLSVAVSRLKTRPSIAPLPASQGSEDGGEEDADVAMEEAAPSQEAAVPGTPSKGPASLASMLEEAAVEIPGINAPIQSKPGAEEEGPFFGAAEDGRNFPEEAAALEQYVAELKESLAAHESMVKALNSRLAVVESWSAETSELSLEDFKQNLHRLFALSQITAHESWLEHKLGFMENTREKLQQAIDDVARTKAATMAAIETAEGWLGTTATRISEMKNALADKDQLIRSAQYIQRHEEELKALNEEIAATKERVASLLQTHNEVLQQRKALLAETATFSPVTPTEGGASVAAAASTMLSAFLTGSVIGWRNLSVGPTALTLRYDHPTGGYHLLSARAAQEANSADVGVSGITLEFVTEKQALKPKRLTFGSEETKEEAVVMGNEVAGLTDLHKTLLQRLDSAYASKFQSCTTLGSLKTTLTKYTAMLGRIKALMEDIMLVGASWFVKCSSGADETPSVYIEYFNEERVLSFGMTYEIKDTFSVAPVAEAAIVWRAGMDRTEEVEAVMNKVKGPYGVLPRTIRALEKQLL